MAKSKRDILKRRLGYSLTSLDRVMEHTRELKAHFDSVVGIDGDADDYQEQLIALIDSNPYAKLAFLLYTGMVHALRSQQYLESFALNAWGVLPDKVERWTNTGADYRAKKEPS